MNIYKVSCYSECGSYFAPYLQFVLVMAKSESDAIQYVKDWLDITHNSFIKEGEEDWSIEVETKNICEGVISYHEDSDY